MLESIFLAMQIIRCLMAGLLKSFVSNDLWLPFLGSVQEVVHGVHQWTRTSRYLLPPLTD